MKITRRQFIKVAGASTMLGLGGISVLGWLKGDSLEATQVLQDEKALKGKRWGMAIDISRFRTEEDYRRVIHACHSIHNVPDIGNTKDEVKWIWTDTYARTFPGQENEYLNEEMKQKPFLLLCNHCDNPPCVRVCPTKATFKRQDGIVMMDQHRCIGCRFCMAACPFGARSFNWKDPRPFIKEQNADYPTRTIGVVEKCTFCFERLAKGLQPACAEKSEGGIVFGDLSDPNSELRKVLAGNFSIRRKAELGTHPSVYYIIGGKEHA